MILYSVSPFLFKVMLLERYHIFFQNDVQDRYEDVMGPLSLFAPYPHEDGKSLKFL